MLENNLKLFLVGIFGIAVQFKGKNWFFLFFFFRFVLMFSFDIKIIKNRVKMSGNFKIEKGGGDAGRCFLVLGGCVWFEFWRVGGLVVFGRDFERTLATFNRTLLFSRTGGGGFHCNFFHSPKSTEKVGATFHSLLLTPPPPALPSFLLLASPLPHGHTLCRTSPLSSFFPFSGEAVDSPLLSSALQLRFSG